MSEAKRRHPNVVNLSELEPARQEKGTRFGYANRRLGLATGGRGIGCSWYEIPPGRTAFPAHYHCANEEAIFVLEGEGTLRIGKEQVKLSAGDYATLPTGPEHAHQVLNTGTAPLRLLAFSTMHTTEVVGYPDSGKLGAMAFSFDASGQPQMQIRGVFRQDAQVGYYDGEKED